MFQFLLPLLAKVGPALLKVGGAAAKAKGAQMLGEQFGQAAASSSMPQFGDALKSSLPAGMPSVSGVGAEPGGMIGNSMAEQGRGLLEKVLGQQGSERRAIVKDILTAYQGSQSQGSGGAGGGAPGGVGGLTSLPSAVSVPPSTYAPVPGGAAEGFGGAGQLLSPLLPKAGLSGDPSEEERRILALQMAMRSLGGGGQGMF